MGWFLLKNVFSYKSVKNQTLDQIVKRPKYVPIMLAYISNVLLYLILSKWLLCLI
jgi:hypothetical protein